ncbi:tetratricopeptide repeat protein [Singulisphaera sp. Ch08]|uniref:Tetratricopeptide repeat protein n=1 Tax=Singulisphaera sp. Ch08 TaxID=3120278 RepID=A0AAU7C687_9BACT
MAMSFAADDPSTGSSVNQTPAATKTGRFDMDWRNGMASYLEHPRIKSAKGVLESLRRAILNRPESQEPDEAERLRLEVFRLYEDGHYYEAEVEARRLVDLQKQTSGENHPDFATALSNLALLVQRQGDLEGAKALLSQTLEIRRHVLGEQHPDFATSLNNLALLLCEQHNLDAAEPLLRQSLEIRREALGATHPDYANGLSGLALLLCERRDLEAAEPLLREALKIRRLALGEQHPDFATSLNNLALLLCERLDLESAEPLLRQALQIRRDLLGSQHPDTLSSSESLSTVLLKTGRSHELQTDRAPSAPTPVLTERERKQSAKVEPNPLEAERTGPPKSTVESQPIPAQVDTPPRHSGLLLEDLAALTLAFKNASQGLLHEASRMQGSGIPPNPLILTAASTCYHNFSLLRTEALRLAEPLALPDSTPDQVASLDALNSLLHAIAKAEADRSAQEETRRSALNILEQAIGLACREPKDQPLLEDCRFQARVLHSAISSRLPSELPPEAARLVAGEHPLANVVALVLGQGNIHEAEWTQLYEGTATAFGKGLAVAVARGRVLPRGKSRATTGEHEQATVVNRLHTES